MEPPVLDRLSSNRESHLRHATRGVPGRTNTKVRPHRGAPSHIVPARQVLEPAPARLSLSLPLLFLVCGYFTGATLALISLLDLTLGVPFYSASHLFDVGLFVSSSTLLYLSYEAREGV